MNPSSGLLVHPVLVNILPLAETMTVRDRFESTFLGLQARQDYRVINLWEIDAEIVFERWPLACLRRSLFDLS